MNEGREEGYIHSMYQNVSIHCIAYEKVKNDNLVVTFYNMKYRSSNNFQSNFFFILFIYSLFISFCCLNLFFCFSFLFSFSFFSFYFLIIVFAVLNNYWNCCLYTSLKWRTPCVSIHLGIYVKRNQPLYHLLWTNYCILSLSNQMFTFLWY